MCKNLAYFAQHFLNHNTWFLWLALNLNLMKKNSLALHIFYLLVAFGYISFFDSCTPAKNIVYFQNLQKDTTLHTLVNNNVELKIRKNDLLNIVILAPAPDINLFNAASSASSSGSSGGNNGNPVSGYLVDNNGNIVMYKLGTVHVEGLTKSELKKKLEKDLLPYLNESVVTIRFLNNHITMLGEVTKPQVLNIPTEQISLLEAIGQSGDLTITGRRDNILVIRETPAGKQFKRLNLNDNSVFYSPFYYLKPDDIVYVEPSKFKIKSTQQNQQAIGYILSGISILITLLAYVIKR